MHRIGLVLALLVTFTALQTGWTRIVADTCVDEDPQTCADEDEDGPCSPTCVDCHGCPGPARALIAERPQVPEATPTILALVEASVDLHPRDQARRIERPPRA